MVALVYWLQSVCWTCVRHRWCPGGPDLLSSAQTKMNIWTCREKSSSRYMLSSFAKRICLNVEMYLLLYLKRIRRFKNVKFCFMYLSKCPIVFVVGQLAMRQCSHLLTCEHVLMLCRVIVFVFLSICICIFWYLYLNLTSSAGALSSAHMP